MSDVVLLHERTLTLPFEIGQPVRHRRDRMEGVVLGAILEDPIVAIVHWHGAPWTFEALDNLTVHDSARAA